MRNKLRKEILQKTCANTVNNRSALEPVPPNQKTKDRFSDYSVYALGVEAKYTADKAFNTKTTNFTAANAPF